LLGFLLLLSTAKINNENPLAWFVRLASFAFGFTFAKVSGCFYSELFSGKPCFSRLPCCTGFTCFKVPFVVFEPKKNQFRWVSFSYLFCAFC
jgi:hypothetical protein